MRVGYIGLKYHYGIKEKGTSYEYRHIEAGFRECQSKNLFNIECFHPDETEELDLLKKAVIEKSLDCLFHIEFNEALDLPNEISKLAKDRDIPIICWSSDASWRFHNFILPRKERYTHFITTHNSTIPWYKSHSMNVIKSQWAGSPLYYKNFDCKKDFDTSFLGQKHGIRDQIVSALIKAGINIHLFGEFWEGYPNANCNLLDTDDMIEIFHRSKINLNFSNPSQGGMPQIKGRHIDIPAAGGFQICTPADNIEEYLEPNKEVVIVNTMPEMVEKIKYYLDHEEERMSIAKAGYNRVQREHLWIHRLSAIFKEIGLL